MLHVVSTNQPIPEALSNFQNLPDSGFIRLHTVKRLYGVSSATIWRWTKASKIPAPVQLSEGCTAWSVKAIRADLALKAGVQS